MQQNQKKIFETKQRKIFKKKRYKKDKEKILFVHNFFGMDLNSRGGGGNNKINSVYCEKVVKVLNEALTKRELY